MNKKNKYYRFFTVILLILLPLLLSANFLYFKYFPNLSSQVTADNLRLDDQEATILAIKKVIPAVVSIIIYDQEKTVLINLFTGERTEQTQKVQKGSGTGFLISADGLILTNKHVVNAGNTDTAEYRIILNSGKQYYAQLIGQDPINDLAVLKIFDKNLPYVDIGDSDQLQIGTTIIAIGNSLGRYQNSATKGIVSGLGRSLYASDQAGNAEALDNVIQTDANINPGNSGGPLIDLNGKVVGINVAVDQAGAAIAFAIPINDAKQVISSIRTVGRIVRARLGVRYIMITPEIAQDKKLPRSSGAWVTKDDQGNVAIVPNSPAAKAGLAEGDIIFEINAIKLEGRTSLLSIVQRYKPGDKLGLKVQRGNKVLIMTVQLDEFK